MKPSAVATSGAAGNAPSSGTPGRGFGSGTLKPVNTCITVNAPLVEILKTTPASAGPPPFVVTPYRLPSPPSVIRGYGNDPSDPLNVWMVVNDPPEVILNTVPRAEPPPPRVVP